MITFSNTKVMNFEGALRGMRNPLESWARADSYYNDNGEYIIGPNDLGLCKRLINGGSEHRKFLRQIFVCTDISGSRGWWQEYSTYKIGTTENSCSTMHKGMSYDFTLDMFVTEPDMDDMDKEYWGHVIKYLNSLHDKYKTLEDSKEKVKCLRKLKEALPEGFIQTRTVTMNYENILTMLRQRKNHKLSEWNTDFVNWAMSLPYIKEFSEVIA